MAINSQRYETWYTLSKLRQMSVLILHSQF